LNVVSAEIDKMQKQLKTPQERLESVKFGRLVTSKMTLKNALTDSLRG
jgi:hypothetical protein